MVFPYAENSSVPRQEFRGHPECQNTTVMRKSKPGAEVQAAGAGASRMRQAASTAMAHSTATSRKVSLNA